jgi:hypothetical protein
MMNAHLAQASADWLDITAIAKRQAIDASR